MQIVERLQRARVVLTQRRAQGIGVPVTSPDQILMCPGQDLDRFSGGAVAGDRTVVMPVGAHQISQELGVPGIGLGPRYGVAVAVAGSRQRIDRIHLIASRNERLDPQAAVGFDPDHDLVWFFGVPGKELMELADAAKPLGQSTPGQPRPAFIHQVHVVVVLRPIVADKNHLNASSGVVKHVRAQGHPATS